MTKIPNHGRLKESLVDAIQHIRNCIESIGYVLPTCRRERFGGLSKRQIKIPMRDVTISPIAREPRCFHRARDQTLEFGPKVAVFKCRG